jgi:hypothetical protein
MHFAFAYLGTGPTYMQYANDGWGPNQIDKVFARETGHVFHATDEYKSGCNCGVWIGNAWNLPIKNYNCVSYSRPIPYEPRVPCIMDSNTVSVCQFTNLINNYYYYDQDY